MCTVLLRFTPEAEWPLLLAAVRDEFVGRAWDPPARHWPATPDLVGGRDHVAGGTWLAVRASAGQPAVAAVLNGVRRPPLVEGTRPTRGTLPLAALDGTLISPSGELTVDPTDYDGFHLVVATPSSATVWSWDALALTRTELAPGDHIVVNLGVDAAADPTVPHFAPLLAAAATPPLVAADTADAWAGWVELLRGDGVPVDDDRALIIRLSVEGRTYGSTSLSLVGLAPGRVRYDFASTPLDPQWSRVR